MAAYGFIVHNHHSLLFSYFYLYDRQTQQLLNLITECLYVSFFGLYVSVIIMTIIRSVRAKEIAMQQIFSLNVMGSHYVLHCSIYCLLYYRIVINIKNI